MKPSSKIFAVLAFLLVATSCAPSVSSSPTPISSTPTPQPTGIKAYAEAVDYIDQFFFENAIEDQWLPEKASWQDGEVKIVGDGTWGSFLMHQVEREPNYGATTRFMYTSGATFSLALQHGTWNTDDYREIGFAFLGDSPQAVITIGKTASQEKSIQGSLQLQPESWYQVSYFVDKNGTFLITIWQEDNVANNGYFTFTLDEADRQTAWRFVAMVNEEVIYIDSIELFDFTSLRDPETVTLSQPTMPQAAQTKVVAEVPATATPVPPTATPTPLPQPPVAGYIPEGAIANLGRGAIFDTAVSPDGSQIALGSVGGMYILDGNDYHEIVFIPTQNPNYAIQSLEYTPDGAYLIAVSSFRSKFEQYINLYDAKSYELVRQTFFPRKSSTAKLVVSPVAPLVAVIWHGQYVNTWDYETDKWNYIYNSTGDNYIRDIRFAPNGDLFLTDSERVVSVMAGGGKYINKYDDLFDTSVTQIAISHSGKLAAGYTKDMLIVWDIESGTAFFKDQTLSFGIFTPYAEIFFSEDDKFLFVASREGLIRINTQTGLHLPTKEYKINGHLQIPIQVEPMPGNRILHVFANYMVAVENLETDQIEHTSSYFTEIPSSSSLSGDGTRYAIANRDNNTVTVYDTESGTQIKVYNEYQEPRFVYLSPLGTYLLLFDTQGSHMINAETGQEFCAQAGLFSPDESILYYKDMESIKILSSSDCTVIHSIKFTEREHAFLTGNFQNMVESKKDGTINIYSIENGELETSLTGFVPEDERYVLAASDDGQFVALGQSTPTQKTWAWNRETGEKVLEITADNPTFAGHILYTWSDKVLNIWDMDQNKALTPVWLPYGIKYTLSPDGRLLAYSVFSYKKPLGVTIQIMDTQTSKVIYTFTGHMENQRAFDEIAFYFSADSQRLVSVGMDGSALMWDVSH